MACDRKNFCTIVFENGKEKEQAETKFPERSPGCVCICNCICCSDGAKVEQSRVTPKTQEAAKATTKAPLVEPMQREKADGKPHPTSESKTLLPDKA